MLKRLHLCQRCLGSERAAELWVDERVDSEGNFAYIDTHVSHAALENDFEYDPTHIELNQRLIHNAS